MCGVKEVSNLVNRPIVDLLGTRVGSTSAEVVPQGLFIIRGKARGKKGIHMIGVGEVRETKHTNGESLKKNKNSVPEDHILIKCGLVGTSCSRTK